MDESMSELITELADTDGLLQMTESTSVGNALSKMFDVFGVILVEVYEMVASLSSS